MGLFWSSLFLPRPPGQLAHEGELAHEGLTVALGGLLHGGRKAHAHGLQLAVGEFIAVLEDGHDVLVVDLGLLGRRGLGPQAGGADKQGELPHLILYGPENSGKTTASLALARKIYGSTWKNNFAYFNASDFFDQGKSYLVRDKRFVRFLGTDDPKKIYKSVIDIFKEIINE